MENVKWVPFIVVTQLLIESHLNACKRQICVNMARHSHSHAAQCSEKSISNELNGNLFACVCSAQNNERVREKPTAIIHFLGFQWTFVYTASRRSISVAMNELHAHTHGK